MPKAIITAWLCFICALPLTGFADTPVDIEVNPKAFQDKSGKLLEIQAALNTANSKLDNLKKQTKKADPLQREELIESIKAQNSEITTLREALEKIATGGLALNEINAEETSFDWKKELVEVTRPLLDSLKQITEKPRMLEQLKGSIESATLRQNILQKGMESVTQERAQIKDAALIKSLDELLANWQQRFTELEREKEVTEAKLQRLEEDKTSWGSLTNTLDKFFLGRALTLFIAISLAVLVWLILRLLNGRMWKTQGTRRTAPLYRFLMYASHALSTFFIICTIFLVFYLRNDVLLLGLGIIILLGGLISLRRALPRFIKEVNLLLNLGSTREGERVMYGGVPYLVKSLNVFSTLVNPCLEGVQRLPLEQIATLYSRPVLANELWFPCDKGDVLLLPDQSLVVVEQQSVEQVRLLLRGGACVTYNTDQFYALDLVNLRHSDYFSVSTVFGLAYKHQDGILDRYPQIIKDTIPTVLTDAGIDPSLYKDIAVEFLTANASSLDIQIWLSCDSQLANRYYKLQRLLQYACVKACNEHQLEIPFPQLALHMQSG